MTRWHSLPAELYALTEQVPATVLLECARLSAQIFSSDSEPAHSPEPCSRLFTAPLRILTAIHPADLAQLFSEIESAAAAGLYAAGYFAYECGSFFEPTIAMPPSPRGQPLAWFGIYDRVHVFDHRTGAFLEGEPPGLDSPAMAKFRAAQSINDTVPDPSVESSIALTNSQYAQRIEAIHEWIRSGDVYQLNFTVPIRLHTSGSLAALYRRLCVRQPAPHCAFLHTSSNRRILSFSPELFFHLESQTPNRRITTRPMKGTAPRGRTTREDRELAEWLRNDPKNRAENVMIVDLLRNDLGRLCRYGSVRTQNLFAVERYPTLLQMTSTVTGELRPDVNFQQILRALFPCGSITGAPKVRAMQLLANIEDEPRGVYTGAIGFFSKQESIFSVAIRTLELDGNHGKMGVGSGIVIDSDSANEFRECRLKAEFLTSSPHAPLGSFSLVETLLWRNGYPLLEFHLDRLEDSAHYFQFPFDRDATKAALQAQANSFAQTLREEKSHPPTPSYKVRLLLDQHGALQITSEPIVSSLTPARARISPQRTDPQDPMLFHKTTHRPLYAEIFQAATQEGYDDALFLNLRGEVTEGAIHNVFVEKGGRWFTPPVECGLLPGVYRRHILETNSSVEEKILHIDDLRQAESIYLCNAVRGLRRAVIHWDD
ncbi:MAG: aminodeoxychorismate synthase component I [Terracidiphilus sp.]|jgi:para-aminobenzoate synthetase/4-amino-4-deoxychorismate lyase